jgi:hypothetical protein
MIFFSEKNPDIVFVVPDNNIVKTMPELFKPEFGS